MKPDYKNWIPLGMLQGMFGGVAVLLLLTGLAFHARPSGASSILAGILLGVTVLLFLLSCWMLFLYRAFSYNGRMQISRRIINGVADCVHIPDGGAGLDVGRLPFGDEEFDIVLSLNGFHAFPDKNAAFRETCRVLKRGGIFCGCFYVAGEFPRTDFFVRRFYVRKGFFTPPFETKTSLESRLRGLYGEVSVRTVNAEGIFRCRK